VLFLVLLGIWHNRRPHIVISGKVIYEEFKKGDIELYWTTVLNYGGPPDPRFQHGLTYLPEPGSYRFIIHKNYGNIYICARNKGLMHESFAYFISDAIKIGTNDMRGYNIVLRQNKLLMDDYEGPTIRISGRVICSHCKKGIISICVYSTDWYRKVRLPPDIAKVNLAMPGDFRLEVPKNFGKVCLVAVNIPEGEKSGNSPKCLQASYINNPVVLKDVDINNIEITFN